jgi:hypothetical protein
MWSNNGFEKKDPCQIFTEDKPEPDQIERLFPLNIIIYYHIITLRCTLNLIINLANYASLIQITMAEADLHPLFVDGLPLDFASNALLLALAAPLADLQSSTLPAPPTNRCKKRSITSVQTGPIQTQGTRAARCAVAALDSKSHKRSKQKRPTTVSEHANRLSGSVEELSMFIKLWKP